jgi:HK97 family phage prohead protease
MPTPRQDETRDEWLERCIPVVLEDGTAEDEDQAVAICMQMWRDRAKGVSMNTKIKEFQATIQLKADGEEGEFTAIFSTFNVIDLDQDVTLPGAFTDGEKVRISYWGHRWQDLPVGRGEIHQDSKKAWVDGKFFIDTEAGKETYLTVKNLGELQEWSYGFDIEDADMGVFEGQDVRFLRRMKVYEVSPVMLGAGIGTGTTDIKNRNQQGEDEGSDAKSSVDLMRTQIEITEIELLEE